MNELIVQNNIYMLICSWGGGGIPSNRLMRLCPWMGLYFHDCFDHDGVAFSKGANRVTRMGSHICGISRVSKFRQVGIWGIFAQKWLTWGFCSITFPFWTYNGRESTEQVWLSSITSYAFNHFGIEKVLARLCSIISIQSNSVHGLSLIKFGYLNKLPLVQFFLISSLTCSQWFT